MLIVIFFIYIHCKYEAKKIYILQGKHCEFHTSNQVLPSFKHMSQEKKWELMVICYFTVYAFKAWSMVFFVFVCLFVCWEKVSD